MRMMNRIDLAPEPTFSSSGAEGDSIRRASASASRVESRCTQPREEARDGGFVLPLSVKPQWPRVFPGL
jgi:hypothetical protein